MTVTTNSDCSAFVIQSEYFNNPSGITFLELEYKSNCASTPITIDITDLKDGITNNTLTLEAFNFYQDETSTKICDGVFYFKISTGKVILGAPITYIESYCLVVDCDLKCQVVEHYKNNKNEFVLELYEALKYATECDNCSCSTLCTFYNELKSLLKINNNDTNCGCQ